MTNLHATVHIMAKRTTHEQPLLHPEQDDSLQRGRTLAHGAYSDRTMTDIKFQIDKCPIPIVWLDTSILFNLLKLKLGTLRDRIHKNRLSRLHQRIYDLTRAGKLLCPEAEQPSEIWVKRSESLGILRELSLGITTRPKVAIEEAQIHRLMAAYIAGDHCITFSYKDIFIEDPVQQCVELLARPYFVTVDSGLVGTVQEIKRQRSTIHQKWEELRRTCVGRRTTFAQQLLRERVGWIEETLAMTRSCGEKAMRGQKPADNEWQSALIISKLGCVWDQLCGKPTGLPGLLGFLRSSYYQTAPSCDVSSILVAKLMVGDKIIEQGDAMDVDHISCMLPYANLMIVDKRMRNIAHTLGLDKKYGTTVCYIGDDKEIADFFDTVDRSVPSHSPFSSLPTGRVDGQFSSFSERTTIARSVFHLDCTAIIAECGCKCARCIEEMKSVFGGTPGVSRFYREGDGVVVEHNASVISVEQLMDIFRRLPSFHRSHFVPSMMQEPRGRTDGRIG